MRILILGGTGAMGKPLQKQLLLLGHDVFVTSRSKHEDGAIHYICGNAHDIPFLDEVLSRKFDCIVDFMSYETDEFRSRAEKILCNTSHYIFISSARVYAPCDGMITEDSPRLLDSSNDLEYLKTDEYALAKARQEDILINSGYKNWTIVRPSITYNSQRLQYAFGEKEEWLYRFMNGEKIVFPQSMSNIYTTMSYGEDVSQAISLMVGNAKAIGECVHIAGAKAITWSEVNDIYSRVLEKRFGKKLEFKLIESYEDLSKTLGKYYQIKYARAVDRKFDNSKLKSIIGNMEFTEPEDGLALCLNNFCDFENKFGKISWKREAYYNRITKDNHVSGDFDITKRVKYCIVRYAPFEIRKR